MSMRLLPILSRLMKDGGEVLGSWTALVACFQPTMLNLIEQRPLLYLAQQFFSFIFFIYRNFFFMLFYSQ